jgi:hypothetical protein
MPARDGTGPVGQGSRTGRGLGNCQPEPQTVSRLGPRSWLNPQSWVNPHKLVNPRSWFDEDMRAGPEQGRGMGRGLSRRRRNRW